MYDRSAELYDLMHPTQDYMAAVEQLRALIAVRRPDARSLLDVGCGTGRHLELLDDLDELAGVDINGTLLGAARSRCPRADLHEADMRTFDLGRRFDVVACLFSAIGYVASYDELVATLGRLRAHAEPGGLIVVEPWLFPDRYRLGAVTMHAAEADATKVAWMYTAALEDGRTVYDIHHLVGTERGVEHFLERHSLALFTGEEYVEAFRMVGLEPELDELGFFGYGLYTADNP